jgi:prefoldin subunit 5
VHVYVLLLAGSEQEILREEVKSLQAIREKQKKRIAELEEEARRLKEEADKEKEKTSGATGDEEVGVASTLSTRC